MVGNQSHDTAEQTSSVSRRRLLQLSGGAGITGLAGCASNRGNDPGTGDETSAEDGGDETTTTESTDSSSDTMRWVQLIPLSGPYSVYGKWGEKGLKLAEDQINENGGVLGKELTIEVIDSETDPNAAVQKANQYHDQGVDHFLQGPASSVSAALQGWAVDNNTLLISMGSSESLTGEQCVSMAARPNRNVAMGAFALGVHAEQQFPEVDNWWYLGADYNWGHSAVEYATQALERNGNSKAGEGFAPLGTSDFATYINKIKSSDANGLMLAISGSDFIRFVQQADSLGLLDELDQVMTMNYSIGTANGLGELGEGLVSAPKWHFNADYGTEGQQQFVDAWREKYDSEPRNTGQNMWSGAWLAAKAMEKAGTTDPVEVADAFGGLEWTSGNATIPRTVRECDHQAKQPIFVGEWTATDEYDFPILEGTTYSPDEHKLIRDCSETGCSL